MMSPGSLTNTLPNVSAARSVATSATRLKTRVLSVDDIRIITSHVGLNALMDEMISRLRVAFTQFDPEQTVVPVRTGLNYEQPHVGLVEWMPLLQKHRQIVVKAVGYHPHNPRVNELPTVLSTLSAYDPTSGHLSALMDGTFLTALRTGAASAIAAQHLAYPQSKTLGLIGVGAQAVTQLHALSRCFEIEQVLIFDREAPVAASFATRAASLQLQGMQIRQASVAEIVAKSDIVCTATSVEVGAGPVFADAEMKPWLHVNAVGADFPGKVEVPLSLLKLSFVCPDFRAQAIAEGECQQFANHDAIDEDAINDDAINDAIGPELFEVVKHPERYKQQQQQLSVFDSTGFALEDQVAMNMMLDYAESLDVGSWLSLESAAADVKNPYSFVVGG
mgnify:CR=1 FL=1